MNIDTERGHAYLINEVDVNLTVLLYPVSRFLSRTVVFNQRISFI